MSAPGEKPQGWADHRLTAGYLEADNYSSASWGEARYSLSRLIVVAGWKAEWEWNTSEVQEDGEDSGVGMVKLRDSEVESEVVAEWVSELSYRGGLPQLYCSLLLSSQSPLGDPPPPPPPPPPATVLLLLLLLLVFVLLLVPAPPPPPFCPSLFFLLGRYL